MKRLLLLMTLALMPQTASSQDAAGELAQAVFNNMAVSYMCRNVIGDAHYLAARTIAKDTLAPVVGADQAALYVDEMDRKFKADPRARNPSSEASQCYTMKSDAMHAIEVARTKFNAAK